MQNDYNSDHGSSEDTPGYNTLKALERAESRAAAQRSRAQQTGSSYGSSYGNERRSEGYRPSAGGYAPSRFSDSSRTGRTSNPSARYGSSDPSYSGSRTRGTGRSSSDHSSARSGSGSYSRPASSRPSGARPSGSYDPSRSSAGYSSSRSGASSRSSAGYASSRSGASSRSSAGYSSSRSGASSRNSAGYTSSRSGASSRNTSGYGASRSGSYTRSPGSYNTARSSRSAGYSPSRASYGRAAAGKTSKRFRLFPSLKGFKRFVLFYSSALLLVLIIGLIIFSSFIGTYEKNQPSNIASSVVKDLSGDSAAKFLKSTMADVQSFEDQDTLINFYLESIKGKELSYMENSDYRSEAPSFDIRADGDTVAKINLVSAGKGAFGLNSWKIGKLDISEYIPDTYSYSVLVPDGYTISINNIQLDESFITEKNVVPPEIAGVTQFAKDLPKFNIYSVSGLLKVPEVSAKDASGNDVGVVTAAKSIVAGGKPTDAFIQGQDEFVNGALKTWAYYFINYNSPNLAHYVQTGSDLYSFIFGSDTMDPIPTYFYDWEYITSVDFTEFEYGNFIKYSDDCYSVDVKYQLTVNFNNGNPPDNAQELDATWVIVKYNGVWAIADLQYHSESSSGTSGTTSGSTTAGSGTSQKETATEPTT